MIKPVITFLPYQQRWLQDESRYKIGMFTRRGGKGDYRCGMITLHRPRGGQGAGVMGVGVIAAPLNHPSTAVKDRRRSVRLKGHAVPSDKMARTLPGAKKRLLQVLL